MSTNNHEDLCLEIQIMYMLLNIFLELIAGWCGEGSSYNT